MISEQKEGHRGNIVKVDENDPGTLSLMPSKKLTKICQSDVQITDKELLKLGFKNTQVIN